MQFRDLQKQYQVLKKDMDAEIQQVLTQANFISGSQVSELEEMLADYVGVKHCVTCANGTDALSLALMVWDIGPGDAVFVPDFTFFSTGEVVAARGAVPIFVDVDTDSFNMDAASLERAVLKVQEEGRLKPRVVAPVDLFGCPADYDQLLPIAKKYNLLVLEDGAQGFGGNLHGKKNCSFGDISTTSFFPAKPLGCYGDGGAVFTDNDEWAQLLKSYRIHGKGDNKYDNVRIGLNSRLDTLQAAILKVKLKAFAGYELADVNAAADKYTARLKDIVKVPEIPEGYYSSWAQYTIQLKDEEQRNGLQAYLKEKNIPSMIYYPKAMHRQEAFVGLDTQKTGLETTEALCRTVLSLPLHPYMEDAEIAEVCNAVTAFVKG